jgi:tryptophan-rich sensory protein
MYNYILAFSSVAITSIVGSLLIGDTTKSPWYNCIKSSITPPNYIFPIVWTILYILIACALSISLNKNLNDINILILLSLLFNISWSYLYFNKKVIVLSFINILILIVFAIIIIMISYKTKEYKITLFISPYLLWICYASILNALSISKRNIC